MPLTSISTDSPILGAQAGDFNYDGLTDLLITTQLPNSSALYTLYLQQSKGNVFGNTYNEL